jgi:hypothetical protein
MAALVVAKRNRAISGCKTLLMVNIVKRALIGTSCLFSLVCCSRVLRSYFYRFADVGDAGHEIGQVICALDNAVGTASRGMQIALSHRGDVLGELFAYVFGGPAPLLHITYDSALQADIRIDIDVNSIAIEG